MNLTTALQRMEELLGLMDEWNTKGNEGFGRDKWDRITALYGEIEDVIHQFEGTESIKVETLRGGAPTTHKDWVSAGWLSGRTHHSHAGRTQLVKVMSKVRARLADPGAPEAPTSIDQLLRALRRFRECCPFIESPPANERQVQDIIWVMLRAQFDRLDREDTLPRFGLKSYRPDFGVPDLRTLLEVKYVGAKTDLAAIQEEILADVPGYLNSGNSYAGLVVFVYDASHKLLDSRKFVGDLRSVTGISDVVVIPGIGNR
ncbi:MAG: hypothetical protein K1Y01_18790 [Vicinamibacteria bacterium]|nr:hypothetical protein [Vicinamibacteria bacterium]